MPRISDLLPTLARSFTPDFSRSIFAMNWRRLERESQKLVAGIALNCGENGGMNKPQALPWACFAAISLTDSHLTSHCSTLPIITLRGPNTGFRCILLCILRPDRNHLGTAVRLSQRGRTADLFLCFSSRARRCGLKTTSLGFRPS